MFIHHIIERLELGKKRYGHGVRSRDDTTTYGTSKNSWMYMALEEYLDAYIYVICDYIRKYELSRDEDEDDNQQILYLAENNNEIISLSHREQLHFLQKLIDIALSDETIHLT